MIVVALCNVGVGMAYAAIPLILMDAVPPAETASANGFNTLCRAIGTSVAGAVIGGALAASATQVDTFTAPSAPALHAVLLVGVGLGGLACLLAWAIPRAPQTGSPPRPSSAPDRAPVPDRGGPAQGRQPVPIPPPTPERRSHDSHHRDRVGRRCGGRRRVLRQQASLTGRLIPAQQRERSTIMGVVVVVVAAIAVVVVMRKRGSASS
jgi:hypothetical protein